MVTEKMIEAALLEAGSQWGDFNSPENRHVLMRAAIEAALAAEPSETAAGDASRKAELWFFRDISDEQRAKLFALFGMPVHEINNHGTQKKALRHILSALRSTRPAGEGVKVKRDSNNDSSEVR